MSDSTKCGDFQSNDLVKRLRDMQGGFAPDEALEAADRIEKLESDLWSMAVDHLAAEERANEAYQARLEAETKLAECEARLGKAVEALERIEDASRHFGRCPEASETTVRYAHETTRRLCSATLAELKGENDGG